MKRNGRRRRNRSLSSFPQVLLAAPLKRLPIDEARRCIRFSAGFTCGSIEARRSTVCEREDRCFPQVLLAAPLKLASDLIGTARQLEFSAGFTCGSIEAENLMPHLKTVKFSAGFTCGSIEAKGTQSLMGIGMVFRRFYLRLH